MPSDRFTHRYQAIPEEKGDELQGLNSKAMPVTQNLDDPDCSIPWHGESTFSKYYRVLGSPSYP
jgi:hypothetical protein